MRSRAQSLMNSAFTAVSQYDILIKRSVSSTQPGGTLVQYKQWVVCYPSAYQFVSYMEHVLQKEGFMPWKVL